MTRDDIIRIAQQAEVPIRGHYDEQGLTPQELERFAALVAAAEREECADVCEGHYDTAQAARAIRARGEK
ncbi:MAG: hypothetical protein EHM17_16150 [Verrucomicrobiaceae bacterium]|nr:MAG: hypothetical protein EHM17_17615 [Verrucomicrobiaceae bacterium]RPJ30068.1 MAG: hypothetical protein EHM17_17360 [Verrucomicrobiaceae bacterium]RPJ30549.1 MAG: hypothetical protein EHM17_16570 [Verrucomicrobiaceae bacterium]RPJ30752.1 MAG: hypothetical protein EHM17_16150 [Verrucomicrobiaceae bacterium]